MAINTQKVVVGGIVAGIVTTALGFATNVALGARMTAEMNAFKPGLSESMQTTAAIVWQVALNLVWGIALVWTYAAIRTRYGPGPSTAARAALLFFVVSCVAYAGYYFMGMMSAGLWIASAVSGLINVLISSWAGAWVYSEATTAAAA